MSTMVDDMATILSKVAILSLNIFSRVFTIKISFLAHNIINMKNSMYLNNKTNERIHIWCKCGVMSTMALNMATLLSKVAITALHNFLKKICVKMIFFVTIIILLKNSTYLNNKYHKTGHNLKKWRT